jgi:7-carboxy-7-deazaguanine synthase
LKISEIFYSIEGEGIEIGRPEIFVRLSGCNLNCSWCDTKYALVGGKEMDINSVLKEVSHFPCQSVSITGGEPLIQMGEVCQLVKELKQLDYWVQLNTNGTLFSEEIFNLADLISMDCKCPSSEMKSKDEVLRKTLKLFNSKTQFKFVISNMRDYKYAIRKVSYLLSEAKNIIFQPEWSSREFAKEMAFRIGKSKCNIRLILQQHKMIWGSKRGV